MTKTEAARAKEIVQAELGETYEVDILFSPLEDKVFIKTLKTDDHNEFDRVELSCDYRFTTLGRKNVLKRMAQHVKEQYAARAEKA